MRILTLNNGSSSLKAALYDLSEGERLVLMAEAPRFGVAGGSLRINDGNDNTLHEDTRDLDDHESVMRVLFEWLDQHPQYNKIDAIGHRVVHGGPHFSRPQRVTPDLIDALEKLIPLAPNHLPASIKGMRAIRKLYPFLAQVACFDTAFHRNMPARSQWYALPREWAEQGVVRYGFHGLSYEYIMQALLAMDATRAGRVIIAHLGNGASVVAVRDGMSIDTSMGFTPTSGLVMGTRCGDVDPGILLYLLKEKGMSVDAIGDLLNKHAGLLGVSGISADMKDLLEKESSDPNAAQAIEMFVYRLQKYIGEYAAALNGLDTFVFTAGIGEHAATIREHVCAGLSFLGIHIDSARNVNHLPIISSDDSKVVVRVMKTNEDLMIARHTRDVIQK